MVIWLSMVGAHSYAPTNRFADCRRTMAGVSASGERRNPYASPDTESATYRMTFGQSVAQKLLGRVKVAEVQFSDGKKGDIFLYSAYELVRLPLDTVLWNRHGESRTVSQLIETELSESTTSGVYSVMGLWLTLSRRHSQWGTRIVKEPKG